VQYQTLRCSINLKAFWGPVEAALATNAKRRFDLPPETKQLYIATAEAADQAYRAVASLRNP
jgi:hypothetical protein